MPQGCKICNSENREKIDEARLQGVPIRRIVAQFGTSQGTVQRHKKHVSQKLVEAKNDIDIQSTEHYLEQMQKINESANRLLDTAMKPGFEIGESNPGVAIMAMREIRGQLALQLDIFKALKEAENDSPTVNIYVHPDFVIMKKILLEELKDCPEQQIKIAERFEDAARTRKSA